MIINTAIWHWPQWTLLVLAASDIMLSVRYHGHVRKPLNAGMDAFKWFMLLAFLLVGGFFS